MSESLAERAYEYVHHADGCSSFDESGPGDCDCIAAEILTALAPPQGQDAREVCDGCGEYVKDCMCPPQQPETGTRDLAAWLTSEQAVEVLFDAVYVSDPSDVRTGIDEELRAAVRESARRGLAALATALPTGGGRCWTPEQVVAVQTAVDDAEAQLGPSATARTVMANVIRRLDKGTAPASSTGDGERGARCPRCGSPEPHLHPAVQFEGEVQPCDHPWHGDHAGGTTFNDDRTVAHAASSSSVEDGTGAELVARIEARALADAAATLDALRAPIWHDDAEIIPYTLEERIRWLAGWRAWFRAREVPAPSSSTTKEQGDAADI